MIDKLITFLYYNNKPQIANYLVKIIQKFNFLEFFLMFKN